MNKLYSREGSSMHVHQTNDEATLSKRSANKLKYFDDPILKHFCKKLVRRTTLINRVYTYRVKIIRNLLQSFLDSFDGDIQVVNIGSGFDSSIFASHIQKLQQLTYFEIDLAEVITKKKALIDGAISCSESKEASRFQQILKNTRFICSDLSSPTAVLRALDDAGFDNLQPTFFIAECVLQYVSPSQSAVLLQKLSKRYVATTAPAYMTIFDQIQPNDAFGLVMQRNLKKRSSELHGIKVFDSPQALCTRLQKSGWFPVCATLLQIVNVLKVLDCTEEARIENLEPFDEYEDFFETCRHYCLSIGTVNPKAEENSVQTLISQLSNHSASTLSQDTLYLQKETACIKNFHSIPSMKFFGFGHASLKYDSAFYGERILTFGGFSKSGSRTNETFIWDVRRRSKSVHWFDESKPCARMHHSMSSMYSIQVFEGGVTKDDRSSLYYKDNQHNMFKSNHILLFGGRGGPNALFRDSFLFDCDIETWGALEYTNIVSIPPARYRHTMVTLEPFNGEKYFTDFYEQKQFLAVSEGIFAGSVVLFGGCQSEIKYSNDLWIFCSVKRKWALLEPKGDIPEGRHSHAMCFDPKKKQIYLSGGLAISGKVLNDFYCFDLQTLEWKKIHQNPRLQLFSHTMTFLPEFRAILFVGGVTPTCGFWDTHATFRFFHLDDLSITEAHTIPQVCGHQTVYLPSQESLYIIGGGLQCFSFGSAYNDSFVVEFELPTQQHNERITSIDCHTCDVSRENWQQSLYPSRLPIHFKNMFLGDCVKKWSSSSYLSTQEKQTKVIVHECKNENPGTCSDELYRMDFIDKNFVYLQQSFSELIERCFVSKKPTYFRSIARQDKTCDFWSSFPSIASDFRIPEVFCGTITPERYFQSCLRVSSANIQLWTHYDIIDNILCQITGRKRVLIYPPDAYSSMKMNGSVSEILDIDRPENRDACQRVIEVILNPGDVLFIPALWLHTIITLTPSIGINVFWRHLDASAYSSKDNYGNHDLPCMIESKERILGNIKDILQSIPKEYQKFTLYQIADELRK